MIKNLIHRNKVIVIVLILVFGANFNPVINAQITSTFYIKTPGYNFQLENFAYPTDYNGNNNTLDSYGMQLISFGHLFYFDDGNSFWKVKPGIDITFFDLGIFQKKVFNPNILDEERYNTTIFQSKIGPMVTINPISQLLIDAYCQVGYSLGTTDYYDATSGSNLNGNISAIRFAGGLNFGYNIVAITAEFNYGVIPIKYEELGQIEEVKINSSYFKVGICLKLSPFKK